MDERTQADASARLKRIAGQVAGIGRMLSDNRYCVDILLQLAAVQGALGELGKVLLANHVRTCLNEAMDSTSMSERRTKLDELVDVFARYCSPRSEGRSRRMRARIGQRG